MKGAKRNAAPGVPILVVLLLIVVAAIVRGAVGMVRHALELLAEEHVVTLDEERKTAMVSNLLVVLRSEQATQPVVNTGSRYR